MADLKQAMIWLTQGKKIRCPQWDENEYIYMEDGRVYNQKREEESVMYTEEEWEFYMPRPQYDPRDVQFKPVDHEDYVVWDESGNRAFAFYNEQDECFYALTNPHLFALDVADYVKIPQRD